MRDKKTPKPSTGTKKDGFSIANLISIIGLVALAFFLYLGFAYSGTNNGTSILYAVLITVGFGLLLYALLYAKGVQNNFEKWRIVEYTLLVVFVGACVATVPVLCHFINVNKDSQILKSYALEDLNEMEQAIADFQNHERGNLSQLQTQLQSLASKPASDYRKITTDTLREYISEVVMGGKDEMLDETAIESFTDKWNGYIENVHHYGDGNDYAAGMKQAIDENRKIIESWNILEIPQAIKGINELKEDLVANLNSVSESYPLHRIESKYQSDFSEEKASPSRKNRSMLDERDGYNSRGKYDRSTYNSVSPSGKASYDIAGTHEPYVTAVDSTFKDECAKRTGISNSGIALSVVIFLLIIFNYVVAYRSTKVSVKVGGSTHDGGIILKA